MWLSVKVGTKFSRQAANAGPSTRESEAVYVPDSTVFRVNCFFAGSNKMSRILWLRVCSAWAVTAALAITGCGEGKYVPVSGKLLFEDGSPAAGLSGRQVIMERIPYGDESAAMQQSSGTIDAQGNFTMGTESLSDGVPAGMQRVMITEANASGDEIPPPVIDKKYSKFETSGLQYEAKSGGPPAEFKLERAK
jgi:hypothetical protein